MSTSGARKNGRILYIQPNDEGADVMKALSASVTLACNRWLDARGLLTSESRFGYIPMKISKKAGQASLMNFNQEIPPRLAECPPDSENQTAPPVTTDQ